MTPEAHWVCPHCGQRLLEHHAPTCVHWGQVVPSEIPGLIESTLVEVLRKKALT